MALTAPYFHDGSAKTLDEALDFMSVGFAKAKVRDEKLKAKALSAKDRVALKAFLNSLTGESTFSGPPQLP